MNRPPWLTYLLGNLPVASLGVVLGAWLIYAWLVGETAGGAPILGACMIAAVLQARDRLQAYRRWEQAWDSMDGKTRKPPSKFVPRLAACLVLLGMGVYLYGHRDNADDRMALYWLVAWLAVAAIYGAIKLIRRRQIKNPAKQPESEPVALSVQAPLMDIPALSVAYQRLPPHCMPLLGSGQGAPK